METITAEQAAKDAKGLTFEIVWAALMEMRVRMEESQKETQKRMEESQKRLDAAFEKTDKEIAELSRNVGGVNNSFGRFVEGLFSVGLDKLFDELGYTFTKQGPHVKFKDKGLHRILAEADYLLEDGQYAMVVEVKVEVNEADVDDHMDRIAVIRQYFDERGDNRTLVGAIAGGSVQKNALNYAIKQGLYVIKQSGESAVLAELPKDFKPREW